MPYVVGIVLSVWVALFARRVDSTATGRSIRLAYDLGAGAGLPGS